MRYGWGELRASPRWFLTPISDPNSAEPMPLRTPPAHLFHAQADRRAGSPTSVNQRVVGSSPTSGAKKQKAYHNDRPFACTQARTQFERRTHHRSDECTEIVYGSVFTLDLRQAMPLCACRYWRIGKVRLHLGKEIRHDTEHARVNGRYPDPLA